jgi:peptide/nickel transport system substrate-binding protein
MVSRLYTVVLRLIAALLILFASSSAVALAQDSAEPTGDIAIALAQDVTTLDAHNSAFTADFTILGAFYETLVYYDAEGKPAGLLAESWQTLSETEWEFKLRQNVTFHNGEPFNAEVVKFNIERYQEPDKGRNPRVGPAITAVTVVDPYTVRLTTPKPDPLLLDTLRITMFVPMKYAAEVGDEGLASQPVGTGPFKFVEWAKTDHLSTEANPDYWGGAPKVKTLTFRIIPEIATRVSALKAGEVQLVTQLTPDQIGSLEESDGLDVVSVQAPRVAQVGFNVDAPGGEPLKDARVRRALAYAVNAQELIDTILVGQGTRVATLAPPNAFGYDASVEPYPFDPEQAQQLLAEAGYADGLEFDFAVPTGGSLLKPLEVAQVLAAYWEAVGVKVNIRSLETGTWIKERDERTISPIFLWNWVGFDLDRMIWANMHSASPWAYNPLPEEQRAEVERLIDAEASTVDQEKRQEIFTQLQRILVDEMATLILYQQNDIYGIDGRLTNVEISPSGQLRLHAASLAA